MIPVEFDPAPNWNTGGTVDEVALLLIGVVLSAGKDLDGGKVSQDDELFPFVDLSLRLSLDVSTGFTSPMLSGFKSNLTASKDLAEELKALVCGGLKLDESDEIVWSRLSLLPYFSDILLA